MSRWVVIAAAAALGVWTYVHIGLIVTEHSPDCDDCPARPWSEGWVVAVRLGTWVGAVVAVARKSVPLIGLSFAALAAAMLALPTAPFPPGLSP